jgi:uncharacterized DUF497 family protein/predicted DNA binding CopG/RHH family protein
VPGFPDDLAQCTGFQWDAGNAEKNWELHQVSQGECEQVFFNRPLLVAPDVEHSNRELRNAALGQTNAARQLAVVFTIRGTLVRVISAREMSRRERRMSKAKRPARKSLPRFANEDQERRFWARHDTADYFDWSRAVRPTLPDLRPSTAAISIRLPVPLLEELKALANERDVPYQSLMKVFLAEQVARQRRGKRKVPA